MNSLNLGYRNVALLLLCFVGLIYVLLLIQTPTTAGIAQPTDSIIITIAIVGAGIIAILASIMWKLKPWK
ncbi:MAG: hypothetical protein KAU48_06235 [Candidatus Thorarchaeota archaeon]|nr:hypothetical protein [Candidatus Thorarchaeota archaeon]